MSVSVLHPCSAFDPLSSPRKRTSSFSCAALANPNPRPAKAPRLSSMGALKRTESCLSLFECSGSSLASSKKDTPVPYTRSLQYQQDQRVARRKLAASRSMAADNLTTLSQRVSSPEPKPLATLSRRGAPQQSPTPSSRPNRTSRPRTPTGVQSASPSKGRLTTQPTKLILPSANSPHAVAIYVTQRTSSPLSPSKTYLPDRPVFPRSKPEPDLYKKALIGRMKTSDEGRKVLTMGPRLAISIWMATKDLEKMVEDTCQRERDLDIIMGDSSNATSSIESTSAPPVLTNSWVVVKPNDDWEMLDCAA